MGGLRIFGLQSGERIEARAQLRAGQRAAARLRILERSPARVVVHTRYDPGLVIERHSHHADEVILVLEGELRVGERLCPAGTVLVIERGTPFGPLVAGERGAVLFETFGGEPGHVSEDPEGFRALCEALDVTLLPESDPSLAPQGRR